MRKQIRTFSLFGECERFQYIPFCQIWSSSACSMCSSTGIFWYILPFLSLLIIFSSQWIKSSAPRLIIIFFLNHQLTSSSSFISNISIHHHHYHHPSSRELFTNTIQKYVLCSIQHSVFYLQHLNIKIIWVSFAYLFLYYVLSSYFKGFAQSVAKRRLGKQTSTDCFLWGPRRDHCYAMVR
jgi:hypothetical protein